MTQITRDDVQHLAQLSSLQLSDMETEELQGDLIKILDHIEQLKELDTTDVTPTYQVTGLENVGRDDEIDTRDVSREELLALSVDPRNHQLKVPKVL
jgi:aspartyl-tRNA(Asn)/glutamyl-tRNA(Gln) amidotransferase subunit C